MKYSYIPKHDAEFADKIKRLGSQIKAMRMAAEMTQQDLSVRAEVSDCTLSSLERGVRPNVSYEVVSRLGEALGYEAEIIFRVKNEEDR